MMNYKNNESSLTCYKLLIKHFNKSALIFNRQGEIVFVDEKKMGFPIESKLHDKQFLLDVFQFEVALGITELIERLRASSDGLLIQRVSDNKKTYVSYEYLEGDYHLLVFENPVSELKLTTRGVTESLSLLEIVLENQAEAVQVCDKMGRLVYLNKMAREHLGFKGNEYKEHNIFEIESFFNTSKDWEEELERIKSVPIRTVEGIHTNILTGKKIPVEVMAVCKELDGELFTIASIKDISKRKKIENKLSETNRFLEVLNSAIDTSSLVTETDLFGNINYVNPKFCEVSQYSQEELIGKNHSIVNSGFHSKEFWAEFWKTIKSNRTWSGEICNKAKDGSLYWVKTLIYPVLDDRGRVLSYLSVRQDITNEKQNEGKLKNTVIFQDLILGISNRFVNIPLNEFEHALNSSLQELGEFVGVDRAYVFDYDYANQTSSNTHEWCRSGIEPQINNLQQIPFSEISEWAAYHFKNELINFSDVDQLQESQLKHLLEVQEIKSVLAIPMMSNEKCIGFIGFDAVKSKKYFEDRDVIILKLFAEMLVNIQSRVKSINELTMAKEEIERINQNLEIEVFEKRRENSKLTNMLSEHEKLALLGEIAAGVAHDMNTPLGSIKVGIESVRYVLESLFKSVLEKCSVEQIHFACQRASTKDIEMVKGGLQTMKETASIFEYINDQYPDMKIEAKLLASSLVKARISVDEEELIEQVVKTQNPLEFLDLIYHIQTIRNLVDTIIASGDKASSVVSNLRSYLQNSSTEELKEVNLRTSIETILTVFSYELKNKIDVYFDVPDLHIQGFENKLYQLWSNIIKNAIEATITNGELKIYYQSKQDNHSISIQNNGPKIREEVLDNMFKKFYTTKGKQQGTGLGLSIVKRIVSEHNGQINVTSDDDWTTFEILFPKDL